MGSLLAFQKIALTLGSEEMKRYITAKALCNSQLSLCYEKMGGHLYVRNPIFYQNATFLLLKYTKQHITNFWKHPAIN